MKFDPGRVIQAELDPKERLLWAGQPRQGIMLRWSDALMIPFSLFWGGFALFWEHSVIQGGMPIFLALFGAPFVLVGLYIMVGRFYVDARQREKTFYGVSSERIVIASGLFGKRVNSLDLRTLRDISLYKSANGRGSIIFGNASPYAAMFSGTSWPGAAQYVVPRFDSIADAKGVYQRIREAQDKLRGQGNNA